MADNRESLSAQSKKRTNYLLLVLGLIFLLLFLLAWCSVKPAKKETEIPKETTVYKLDPFDTDKDSDATFPNLGGRGDAQLSVTPSEVNMPKVIIGSDAEVPLILRADNAPILLLKKNLAEEDENGFVLSGPCMEKDRLAKDEECVLKVSWNPKSLKSIQNMLTIMWREDSRSVFDDERMTIFLKAQSTDSKDCIICPNA